MKPELQGAALTASLIWLTIEVLALIGSLCCLAHTLAWMTSERYFRWYIGFLLARRRARQYREMDRRRRSFGG